MSEQTPSHRAERRALIAAMTVLALGAFARADGLFLPHDRGDQLIWAGVSMNVVARGARGYTVRGIAERANPFWPDGSLISFEPSGDPTKDPEGGVLLEGFVADGEKYWDAPMVNQPPAFVGLLIASHAVLGQEGDGYPVIGVDPRAKEAWRARLEPLARRVLAEAAERGPAELAAAQARLLEEQKKLERGLVARLVREKPMQPARAQLWAALVPFLADLLAIALVLMVGRALAGPWAGTIAGAVYACDPLAMFCSGRLLSNTTVTAASLAAIAIALKAIHDRDRSPIFPWAIAGALGAFALLVKVSALFLVPAIALGSLIASRERRLQRGLLVFGAIVLLLEAPWALLQWKLLGHPLGLAWRNQADRALVSGWGSIVSTRTPLYYLESLVHRSPLLLGGLAFAPFILSRALARARGGAGRDAEPATLAAFALLGFAGAISFEEKEARHLLVIYPALAILAAIALDRARRALEPRLGERGAAFAAAVPAILAIAWGLREGSALILDTTSVP